MFYLCLLAFVCRPSWGAWVVNDNATTLFEMWGAYDGGAKGTASHNHVMFSTFMPWLYQTLVGVAMDDGDYGVGVLPPIQHGAGDPLHAAAKTPPGHRQPAHPVDTLPTGYSRFRVAPQLLGGLSAASATVVTMRGTISVSWARSPAETAPATATAWLNVTLPLGADTAVTVPLATRTRRRGTGDDGRLGGCSSTESTVREGAVGGSPGSLVWHGGTFAPGVPGIRSAQAVVTAGHAAIRVLAGSGSYAFSATC